jgi:signal peptidase I
VLSLTPRVSFTHIRTVGGVALQICALVAIAAAFFVRTPHVAGMSMSPRVAEGEVVMINTLAYRMSAVRRGEIVAFRHDAGDPETYLKRVIGLPGERIAIDRGVVSVDGRVLAEPYVRFHDRRSFPTYTVPADTVYVLGDNRANSDDSRMWGAVAESAIVGQAVLGVWPLDHWGVL